MSIRLGRIVEGTSYRVDLSNTSATGSAFVFVRWIPNPGFAAQSFQLKIDANEAGSHLETCPLSTQYAVIEVEVDIPEPGSAQMTVSGLVTAPMMLTISQDMDYEIEIDPASGSP